jgi:hypothetical protein
VGRGFSPGISRAVPSVVLVAGSLLLAACSSSSRQSKTPAAPTVSSTNSHAVTPDEAKRFVQRFYDWYLPMPLGADPLAMLARPEMQAAMAPELLRALKEDSEAAARNHDEIVGLDFDPVTNSQDPCERYEAVRARQTGDTYWVDVRGAGGCAPHDGIDVTVQLTCSASSACSIFNFQYPGPQPLDLRSELKRLKEDRARPVPVARREPSASRSKE